MTQPGHALRIRAVEMADAPQLNAWWNDGAVMAHAGFPEGLGQRLEDTQSLVAQYQKARHSGLWIIEYEGQAIGESSYRVLQDNTIECGWKICEAAFQNRGIGTAAIRLTLLQYFTDTGFRAQHPVSAAVWDTNLNNLRAQRVYEQKIGARRLGVRDKAWHDQRGVWQSAVDYRLERVDFLAAL